MEKNYNEQEAINNLRDLDIYMSTVSPLGDWRNPVLDMPLMTKYVNGLYRNGGSVQNKLAFYNDIVDSFTNVNKRNSIANDRLRGMGNMIGVIQDLVNDTINTRSTSTFAFLNESLRKELVQGEYRSIGKNLQNEEKAVELDLSAMGVNPDALVSMLANLNTVDLYLQSLKNINDGLLPNITHLAETVKRINPNYYTNLRQLLAATEGLGVCLVTLKALHDAAKGLVDSGRVNATAVNTGIQGLGVSSVITPMTSVRSLEDIQRDVNNIAEIFKPFGNNIPDRIRQVLNKAGENDITDIKNIILKVGTKPMNPEKVALALSTTFSLQNTPQLLQQAPKNILLAWMYVAKVHADAHMNRNCQTGDIAKGLSHITGLNIQATDGYRINLTQAIAYDLVSENCLATMSVGILDNMPKIQEFATKLLSKTYNGRPALTKTGLMNKVAAVSPYSKRPTMPDVDGYLNSFGFYDENYQTGNMSQQRQKLVTSIIDAMEMI